MSVNHKIQQCVQVKQQRIEAQQLALALMHALRIDQGCNLAAVLSHGRERNNERALAAWVHEQMDTLDGTFAGQRFELLRSRLVRVLRELQEIE